MKYMFELDGMQSMSHWQGAGVSGTEWDDVSTGYGDTEWQAACDAIDNLCGIRVVPPTIISAMDDEASKMDGDTGICDECNAIVAGDCDGMSEECDNSWIVNLYVRW
jgi:hypothetical protein